MAAIWPPSCFYHSKSGQNIKLTQTILYINKFYKSFFRLQKQSLDRGSKANLPTLSPNFEVLCFVATFSAKFGFFFKDVIIDGRFAALTDALRFVLCLKVCHIGIQQRQMSKIGFLFCSNGFEWANKIEVCTIYIVNLQYQTFEYQKFKYQTHLNTRQNCVWFLNGGKNLDQT